MPGEDVGSEFLVKFLVEAILHLDGCGEELLHAGLADFEGDDEIVFE